MHSSALTAALFIVAGLPAQVIDTMGGNTYTPTDPNISKSNLYRVDSSRILLNFEVNLNLAAPDTLTFFAYRHPQRDGNATLEWSTNVAVSGGGGAQWYGAGPMALPLVCNNYYLLGVAWSSSVQYYYTLGAGTPASFGDWERACTIRPPMPVTTSITGSDIAQYFQRLTTVPLGAVGCVGTPCGNMPPRLVASTLPALGTTVRLHVTNGTPSVLGVYAFTLGPTLAVPTPLFGCSTWLNLAGGAITNAVILDASGFGTLALPIPNNGIHLGTQLSLQAGLLSSPISFTNALDLSL